MWSGLLVLIRERPAQRRWNHSYKGISNEDINGGHWKVQKRLKSRASPDGLVHKVWCGPRLQPRLRTTPLFSSHALVVAHIEGLEGLMTRIYNYVLGLWGEKKREREILATDVSSGWIFPSKKIKNIKKKKREWRVVAWLLQATSEQRYPRISQLTSDSPRPGPLFRVVMQTGRT